MVSMSQLFGNYVVGNPVVDSSRSLEFSRGWCALVLELLRLEIGRKYIHIRGLGGL